MEFLPLTVIKFVSYILNVLYTYTRLNRKCIWFILIFVVESIFLNYLNKNKIVSSVISLFFFIISTGQTELCPISTSVELKHCDFFGLITWMKFGWC